jgi:hypothetical protein
MHQQGEQEEQIRGENIDKISNLLSRLSVYIHFQQLKWELV